jgi:archaellum component FlaC
MEKFNQLKALLESVEADAKKFYENGSGAAGTRVRKAMQEIKVLAQDIRNEVTELKNKEEA